MKKLLIVTLVLTSVLYAQDQPAFQNRELVRVKCQNEADFFISVLEKTLDQKTLDQIQAALFPPATEAETKDAKQRALDILIREGVAADDPALVILESAVKPVTFIDEFTPAIEER